MNCREAGDWLSPYLDGEMDTQRRAQFEVHLAGCARCAGELAVLRRAAHLLAAPRTMAQPEGLLAEFKQRLAAETPRQRPAWWNVPRTWSVAALTATAAAAGLLIYFRGPSFSPRESAGVVQVAQQPPRPLILGGSPEASLDRAPAASPRMAAPPIGRDAEVASPSTRPLPPRAGAVPAPPMSPAPPSRPTEIASTRTHVPLPPEIASSLSDAKRPRPVPPARQPSPRVTGEDTLAASNLALKEQRAAPKAPAVPGERGATYRFNQEAAEGVRPPADAAVVPRLAAPPAARTEPTTLAKGEVGRASGSAPAAGARRADEQPKIEIVIHWPNAESEQLRLNANREPAGGFGAAAGGAGQPAAPPAGPSAPGGAPGAAGMARSAPAAVAPEVAAAMRVPVDLKVSNVSLTGLTDRLAAEAEVPIVVSDPEMRNLQVSAELNAVPLYQVLQTVAARANLVIEPRPPGGITLQLAEAPRLASAGREAKAQPNTPEVWSPAWGALPRNGFAVPVAQAPNTRGRDALKVRIQAAKPANGGRANTPPAARLQDKDTPAATQRRVQAADQRLAQQNQRLFQDAAAQLGSLKAAPLGHCPHCRQPLAGNPSYTCSKCRRAVQPADARCAHCGLAHPALCPHCRQPLAEPPKAGTGR